MSTMKAHVKIPSGWRKVRSGEKPGSDERIFRWPYWLRIHRWDARVLREGELLIRRKRVKRKTGGRK